MSLTDRLVAELADHPIPFDDYMARALYDPDGGYFAGERLRSETHGDFLTSPEVSPMFGATLAAFVEAERRRLDDPEGFTVVEVAAGSGSLLAPLLAGLEQPVRALAVEVSPAARRRLRDRLPGVAVFESIEDVGDLTGVIVANELLDNLPMALAVRDGDGWRERWVGADEGRLRWVDAPVRPEVAAWLHRWAGPVPEGGVVEVQLEGCRWIEAALSRLVAGALVVIDYGETAKGLSHRRPEGTLRTYQAHHLGPHPFDAPGETDLTADVNFSSVVDTMAAWGTVEYLRQDEFLEGLGLRERLVELRERELTAARADDTMGRLEARSARTAGETLLHPRGLGDFRVAIARR